MTRILFVTDYYAPHIGGRENVFKSLAEGLVGRGYHVRVITSLYNYALPKFETVNGVHIHRIWVPLFWSRFWFGIIAIIPTFIAARDVHIIHSQPYVELLPAWISSILRRKKFVITLNEINGDNWNIIAQSLISFVYAKIAQLLELVFIQINYDAIVAISKYTLSQFKNLKRMSEIATSYAYPPIDYNHWSRKRIHKNTLKHISDTHSLKGKWVYIFFGRPGITKGLDTLITAIPKISRSIPHAVAFLIVSHQEKRGITRIQKLLKKCDPQNFILIDSVSYNDLPSYLACGNCIVVPSLTEGFGYTGAESSALSIPLVVSKTGSLPEVVSGKVNFFKPGNHESLARAIEASYNKQYTFIRSKKFTRRDFLEKYLNVYQQVIQK